MLPSSALSLPLCAGPQRWQWCSQAGTQASVSSKKSELGSQRLRSLKHAPLQAWVYYWGPSLHELENGQIDCVPSDRCFCLGRQDLALARRGSGLAPRRAWACWWVGRGGRGAAQPALGGCSRAAAHCALARHLHCGVCRLLAQSWTYLWLQINCDQNTSVCLFLAVILKIVDGILPRM